MNSSIRNANLLSGAHRAAVNSISFSHSDEKYVSCSDDASVRIWSMNSDQPEMTYAGDSGHLSEVKCAEWHPFRSLIASGGRDSLVKLWDPRQEVNNSFHATCSYFIFTTLLFIKKTFFCFLFIHFDKLTCGMWPKPKQACVSTIHTHKLPLNCLSWSANGNMLATAAKDSYLRIFDLRNLSKDCLLLQGHDSDVTGTPSTFCSIYHKKA